jgi:hypothetical protein
MFGLLKIISGASQAKNDLMKSFMGPDSAFGKLQSFKNDLTQMKGDLVSQPMRDLGFGDANQLLIPPKAKSFDSGTAANSGLLMRESLRDIGANNPAAGMMQLGTLDLATPDMRQMFAPAKDDGYMTPLERERGALVEDNYLKDLDSGPNAINPPGLLLLPEPGMLRIE